MCKFTIITFLVILCESVFARTFDQRQTGDLNVQVDVKNLKIFALTKGKEEYVDYDYAYDYSEMTIKPQNGTSTTIKPFNTTTVTVMMINKDNATAATELESTTTQMIEKSTTPPEHVVTVDPTMLAGVSSTAVTTTFGLVTPNNTTAAVNSTTTLSDCKKGFLRNKGNCEHKLQNPSNILLKMLQKSKSSGGNGIRKP